MQSGPDTRAMEEWKLLSAVIARYESFEFQLRGWLLVILGGLIAALYAERSRLPWLRFAEIGSIVTIVFLWMELTLRRTKRKAIFRSRAVESALRGEVEYDGPAITQHLTGSPPISRFQLILMEVRVSSVWVFYLGLLVIILIFAISARH